ncbi:hypothetical protein STRDD10_01038 [Streptococcus sp. DD10]|nr:class IIb bacteriocin, lactobin A/cerein 7B family [Streptococcus sp. DD10]KXT74288.1 hypothetical protein STRDD10_01038 [Streptococcus sp. DD10]
MANVDKQFQVLTAEELMDVSGGGFDWGRTGMCVLGIGAGALLTC